MNGFLAGLITGCLVGVVATLLLLVVVAGSHGAEHPTSNQKPDRRVFFATLGLLAVCGASYAMNLEKSALITLLLSVLLIAKLGGTKRGIAAAGLAAGMLAWFLPPNGSLWVSGLDNRLALILFILGTIVGSILMEGKKWIKRWVAMANPD
jgi:K+-sensing histidine kinase KdpD